MKRIGTRAKILMIVILYFLVCTGILLFRYYQYGEKWVIHPANQNVYKNGRLISPGSIVSSDGVVLFTKNSGGSVYTKDETLRKSMLHALGDYNDNINTGVIKTQKARLIGYDFLNGMYHTPGKSSKISLTLNAALSKTAYEALGSRNGAVGVYNYKTGELLCMVSKPSYDPENPPDLSTGAYKGVFVNRLTGGVFTPGSIFKIITAYAAIETIDNIFDRTFTCKGGIEIDGEKVKCAGTHGKIDFQQALAHSCNSAFAEISVELGGNTLAAYAKRAGIGTQFNISGVKTSKGMFQIENASKVDLAWAGIGQHTTLVNPMQYMIFMGAIANGGEPVAPYYIKNVKTALGLPRHFQFLDEQSRMLSKESADTLKKLMRNNTKVSYNDASFSGMKLCAKTGTAEVDGKNPHGWFAGFLDREDAPLAFVVIAENGGSASSSAVPIARNVLTAALKTLQ